MKDQMLFAAITGNGLILAILTYLAVEVRRDVRETRDKVLVMWEWYQTVVERRIERGESRP